MRTGGCTVQQALTAEALSLVKQSVILAKRRGHAQVTPLHVASTMLASTTGLLRTACLQSNSHPLRCKALELCFNVALSRLPASNSSPMLGPQSQQHPSISNALVAAFKRAQAHQRRGSIENQQQPLLAVKIEMEQLIISILDDPSVSRVMREADFSSTQVKSKVEQAVSSIELCSSQNSPVSSKSKDTNNFLVLSGQSPPTISTEKVGKSEQVNDDDVAAVINNLSENMRKRSVVVVGECVSSLEAVVQSAIGKIEKREVPENLRDVKFINLSISSFRHRSRVEVDQKVMELKNLVRTCLGKGVILYVGDMKWTIDYRANLTNQTRIYYCPVEHMIMELGKLVYGNNYMESRAAVWIMGIATFQTYMRCKSGNPSLGTLLGIHPLTIPAGSLKLSLISHSEIIQSQISEEKAENEVEEEKTQKLSCCAECCAKFEIEFRSLQNSNNSESTSSTSLPAWLQQYKNEKKAIGENYDQNCVPVADLYRKWNSICYSIHHQQQQQPKITEKSLTFSCILPSSSMASGFSYDHHQPYSYLYTQKEKLKEPWRDRHFWTNDQTSENNDINVEPKQLLDQQSNRPSGSTPSSALSASDVVMDQALFGNRFKELNSENFKIMCNALEKKVPWQKNVIPEIASTVLQCRSGIRRRSGKVGHYKEFKEETWLLFQGNDIAGKEKVASELAKLVFGSETSSNLIHITLSSFSSTRSADSTEDNCCRNKRSRDEQSCSYIQRFAEAVSTNPHRVFLVEDVDQADYSSQIGFKRAIERGKVTNSNGEEVSLGDAIVIFSCESFSARSRACSPPPPPPIPPINKNLQPQENQIKEQQTVVTGLSLDLNISINDDDVEVDNGAAEQSVDDVGLLESIDGRVIFQILEL